ncbi:hypothetical protein IQ07DRAFT_521386 [Pyrenochaeta sp. DS3sAY3a]|nr:hypothetical protein IQ07DRAFT_521386 [Pyrenochaeta sp. DS3sAY3a]
MAKASPKERLLDFRKAIQMNISMVEPVIFLQGFDQKPTSERNTVVLRGSLRLRVNKPSKIRSVKLKFQGKSVTKWPQGFPSNEIRFEETNILTTNVWSFFNAQSSGSNADHLHKASRVALQANSLWNAVKGDSPSNLPPVVRKGYRIFLPGDYIYNFELPLESSLPETIDLKYGSVKYELEATVDRAGAFSSNLVEAKEVTLIRIPLQGALEQVEPIAVRRTLGDRMDIEVAISGKSFPLGSQIPVSICLTPLIKARLHWIRVLATEHVDYMCSKRVAHRAEPIRTVHLFEKRPDVPPSDGITDSGGDDCIVGTKGIEFLVPLPKNVLMKRNGTSAFMLHPDTTYENIQVHHWIKIVIRLSTVDQANPIKRRNYEICVDSPFRVLSQHVTESVTTLPSYSAPDPTSGTCIQEQEHICTKTLVPTSAMPSRPRKDSAATLFSSKLASHGFPLEVQSEGPAEILLERPTYLFRAVSFDPPAFEDEGPPLSLEAPPPMYESLVR